jgi:Asp-tRNA(Asn)/Glu-tRNA(Gln) amidotransferase A subunit family amidase
MDLKIFCFLFFLFLWPSFALSSFTILAKNPAGTVLSFLDHQTGRYLIDNQALLSIDKVYPEIQNDLDLQLSPATTIWITEKTASKEYLQSQIDLFGRLDDVWNENFLQNLFLSYEGPGQANVECRVYEFLKLRGVARVFVSDNFEPAQCPNAIPTFRIPAAIPAAHRLPPGPLFISRSQGKQVVVVHHVYRLYLDEYDGFLFGSIPDIIKGGWILTNITETSSFPINDSPQQLIPVPSRLRMISIPNLPLSGTRFGLKDIYDAEGLPTAAGSLAYLQTHEIPTETAPSIEKLLQLGAVMVGKTRTSQFAHGAHPWEFRDVSYSWNPRGDGHLTASASSSGSACAIAAYEWLEFTVGSDTRGSVRKPAALVGAYGIRPSLGSMDLRGVVPLSEEMDTAGFFARHPKVFHEVASKWYVIMDVFASMCTYRKTRYSGSPVMNRKPRSRFPSKLFYPIEHFHMRNRRAQELVDDFVDALQQHLSIMPINVNFTEMITPFFPNGSFPAFQLSSNQLAEYRSWNDVGRPTTDQFFTQFGKQPTFDPIPEKMFARAQSITEADFSAAVGLKRYFRDSISEHIFKHDEESCSDSLFIYDAATGGVPSYRVEDFNHLEGATPFLLTAAAASPNAQAKASDFFNFLASMGELPEVTIPIGQVQYFSVLSRTWEPIPVAVQLVARKGCDQMLLDVVLRLAEVGVVREVNVGRAAF